MKVVYHPEVEKIIRSLPEKDKSKVIRVIDLFIEYKFNLTQLYLKKIVKGLWEFRAGKYRLLFGIVSGEAVVVRVFRKSSQKTPKQEQKLAIQRLKKYGS